MNKTKEYYWKEIFKAIQKEAGLNSWVELSTATGLNAGTLHSKLKRHKDIGLIKFLEIASKMDKGTELIIKTSKQEYKLKI